jgi:hypothetical protein
MAALPNFLPAEALHLRWVKAIEAMLRAMTSTRVTHRYDGNLVPYEYVTGVTTRPVAVTCIAATQVDDPSETESGARVTWEWVGGSRGVVRINAIDLTSASALYDVTLEVR